MAEQGKHEGPPTHAVTFVWNGQEVNPYLNLWSLLYHVLDTLKTVVKLVNLMTRNTNAKRF